MAKRWQYFTIDVLVDILYETGKFDLQWCNLPECKACEEEICKPLSKCKKCIKRWLEEEVNDQ